MCIVAVCVCYVMVRWRASADALPPQFGAHINAVCWLSCPRMPACSRPHVMHSWRPHCHPHTHTHTHAPLPPPPTHTRPRTDCGGGRAGAGHSARGRGAGRPDRDSGELTCVRVGCMRASVRRTHTCINARTSPCAASCFQHTTRPPARPPAPPTRRRSEPWCPPRP